MPITNFKELSREDLDAQIELYQKAGVEIPEGLTTKPKIVAFLEEVSASEGVPKELSQDDIDADPKLGEEGHAAGDVILVPAPKNEDDKDDDIDEDVEALSVEYINPEVGLTTREFTKAVHGKDFVKTAKVFASKFNGTIL